MRLVIACALALLVAMVVTPMVKKLAFKVGAVDIPNARKVHVGAMPRMGGLAIFIAFFIGVLSLGLLKDPSVIGLMIGGAMIVGIGIVDDIKGVTPIQKIIVQFFAALVFIFFEGYIEHITNPMGGVIHLHWLIGVPITILWIVGISNAINLVDGLDGLAAGISSIAAFTMAVCSVMVGRFDAALVCFILVFAILGFLHYNFHPAQIFMGDSGSLFLGYVLACLAIMGYSKGATIFSLVVPILILGIPIFDTFFAIIRRKINNQPIFQADKGHLHHRLLALGLSHRETVLVIYTITLFMGICAILLTMVTSTESVMILILVLALILWGANKIGIFHSHAIDDKAVANKIGKNEKELENKLEK